MKNTENLFRDNEKKVIILMNKKLILTYIYLKFHHCFIIIGIFYYLINFV